MPLPSCSSLRGAARVAAIVGAAAGTAGAQPGPRPAGVGTSGGDLTPQVHYAAVERHEGTGRDARTWLAAVVLWRHAAPDTGAGAPPSAPQAWRAAQAEYRRLRRAAEDEGRWFLGRLQGGNVDAATYDSEGERLTAAGLTFRVPARDSALVVLVDARGARPEVAGTAYIPAAAGIGLRPVTWTSGDTTFIVHPPPGRREAAFAAAIRASPAVRAFLE